MWWELHSLWFIRMDGWTGRRSWVQGQIWDVFHYSPFVSWGKDVSRGLHVDSQLPASLLFLILCLPSFISVGGQIRAVMDGPFLLQDALCAGMRTEHRHRYRHQMHVCVYVFMHMCLLSSLHLSLAHRVLFPALFHPASPDRQLDFESQMMGLGFSLLWLHLLNYPVLLTLYRCVSIPPLLYTHKPHSSS